MLMEHTTNLIGRLHAAVEPQQAHALQFRGGEPICYFVWQNFGILRVAKNSKF